MAGIFPSTTYRLRSAFGSPVSWASNPIEMYFSLTIPLKYIDFTVWKF